MNDNEKIDSILSRPGRVSVAGSKSMGDRPLSDRFRELIRVGALSTILLVQAVQGVQASPLMEHVFKDHSQAPVAAQVVQAQDQAEHAAVEFVNPLDRPGLEQISTDHGINGIDLIRDWRDAGVEPAQVLQLTQTLLVTQSPVFVRGNDAKEEALSLSEKTAGIFSVESQEQALEFLEGNSVQALASQGLVSPAATRTYVRDFKAPEFEHSVRLWELASRVAQDDEAAPYWADESDQQTPARYQQSIELLKQSVQETGLNSLRVPMSMWSSSERLDTLSSDLVKANHELQQVTGWEGQVLGVKGHLNLMVGSPYGDGGVTHAGDGKFDGYAAMNVVDHEVFHVIDGLASVHAGHAPDDRFPTLMGEHAAHFHDGHDHHPAQVWSTLEKGVDANLGGWSENLHAQALTGERGVTPDVVEYATASHEKLAYSFESLVAVKLGEDSVLARHTNGERALPPSHESAAASAPMWEAAFNTLNETWWSKLPSVGQDQALTAAVADAPAAPIPGLADVSTSDASFEVTIPSISSWRQARNKTPEPTISSPQVQRGHAF